MSRQILLKTIVWKEGKHYVSQCLNVDVASFGATKKAALENLKEALELYFESERRARVQAVQEVGVASLILQHA